LKGNCVTGKRSYDSRAAAEEALIDHRIQFNHRPGSGPINVYQCSDCGNWHFTSKGMINPLLNDARVKDRIEREQQARKWEDKFR
jgi:hypothetical protein